MILTGIHDWGEVGLDCDRTEQMPWWTQVSWGALPQGWHRSRWVGSYSTMCSNEKSYSPRGQRAQYSIITIAIIIINKNIMLELDKFNLCLCCYSDMLVFTRWSVTLAWWFCFLWACNAYKSLPFLFFFSCFKHGLVLCLPKIATSWCTSFWNWYKWGST